MADQSPQGHILVVDDEPLNLDVLQQELEDRDFLVDLAANGGEALARVALAPPDVILLDVVMPGLDGIEVCRRLKGDADTAHIPIIMMTALSAVEDRIRGIEAGADDYLAKPVDDRELMARVTTALAAKRAFDMTRGELASATDRLRSLGSIDRDVTLVAIQTEGERLPGIAAAIEADGMIVERPRDGQVICVITDADPQLHADRAIRVAERAARAGAAVAMESGPAQVGSKPVEMPLGRRWEPSVEGPTLEAALAFGRFSSAGQVVIGPESARRLEGVVRTTSLSDTDAVRLDSIERPVDTAGSPALEMPWPADYADLLDPLREAWSIEGPIFLTRGLSGKSGARVFLVDITMRGFSGQAILKLDRPREATADDSVEAQRHRRAYDARRQFADAHLPRVVRSYASGNEAAVLSTVAGRGLEYVVPWAQADHSHRRESAHAISRGILADWNGDYRLSDLRTPQQLMEGWLGSRLHAPSTRIAPYLGSAGLDPEQPTFYYEGHWFPNPFAFARGVQQVPARAALRAAVGRVHGDLHGFNVLLTTPDQASDYVIIDLAYFAEDANLFFDNAYLELGFMLDVRETAHADRWLRMVGSLVNAGTPDPDDLGIHEVVRALRGGVRAWIDDHEPNRLAYMESQYALARVAVGLNFVNKRVSDQMRLLALLYSASMLKSWLRLLDIDWPRAGSEFAPP